MAHDEQSFPIKRHDRHVFLAAGAGSGKTRVLVHRYLRYLADHDYDPALPARMLAITFTEKAAQEMQERVHSQLREHAAAAEPELAARLEDLAREMEAAPISTIHGFCSRLLRENAVEAGLDPLFRVPDEVELHGLGESLLDRLFAEADEDLLLLTGEFGLKDLREGILDFRELRRSLGLDPGDLDPEAEAREQDAWAREQLAVRLAEEQAALPDRLTAICSHFPGGVHPKEKGQAQILAARACLVGAKAPDAGVLDNAVDAMARISQSNLDDGDRFKKSWPKLRTEIRALAEKIRELEGKGPAARPPGMRLAALRLAARYEGLIAEGKRARGWLDFEDLQREAVRLLESRPALLARMREQYRQIFVDEFQDTNPLQLRLLRRLMPEGEPAGRRALFLVGDHRQSIYAFRNADLEVFRREGERMEERGESRSLSRNYRSRARLIDFFNGVFPAAEFPPMDPVVEDGPEPRVLLQMTEKGKQRSRPEARREAAEALAALLARAHAQGLAVREDKGERPIEWSDMALLVRSGSAIGPLAKALAEKGIPYEAAGGRDFFLRQELRDLEDLVAALDDPYSRLKMLRALRGDIVALSTADLLALLPVRRRDPSDRDGGELLERLLGGEGGSAPISEEGRRRIGVFAQLYGEFERRLHREPLSELIPALVRASGFEIQAAVGPYGLKVQRNLRQLADLVGELEANGPLGVREFLDYMERVRDVAPRREEAWVPEEGEKAVRILTVHAAKGLEFPLVVLADMDRDLTSVQRSGNIASLRAGGGDQPLRALLGLRWKSLDDVEVRDAVHHWIKEERRLREEAELRRLFYVGATRARDYLVLSGLFDGDPGEFMEAPLKTGVSFMAALREGLAGPLKPQLYRLRWTGSGEAEADLGPGMARERIEKAAEPEREPAWEGLLAPPPDAGRLELPVTGLSLLGACPLRWFLERRLGLRGRGSALPFHPEEGAAFERFAGADFGTRLHGILERWDFREDPPAAFEAACPPGLAPDEREAARDLLLGFFKADNMWVRSRLAAATQLRREESFTMDLDGVTLVGQIDLVLKADGQRFLLDWKSDSVDAESAQQQAHHYQLQMGLYALALEKAGRPVDRAFLAFLRPARFVELDVSEKTRRWAASKAEKLGRLARELSAGGEIPDPREPPCRGCPWRDGLCPEAYRRSDCG